MADLPPQQIQSLLSQISQKNNNAFEQLYRHYADDLFAFIKRRTMSQELAEEALHDTFMALWNKPFAFNGKAKFSTWLFSVAKRRVVDIQRKQMRSLQFEIKDSDASLMESAEDFSWDIIKDFEDEERSKIMTGCINKLPGKYRTVTHLVYYQEMGYKQVAEELECPEGTIKSRMTTARTKIKACLANAYSGIKLWREQ